MAKAKLKMTQKVEETQLEEQTAAADTIASKTGVIASVSQAVSGMNQGQVDAFHSYMLDFFQKSMGQAAAAAASISPDQSTKNQSTIVARGAVKEELDAILGESLTEEFKDKAVTLFEAAVTARVAQETAILEEQAAEVIAQEIDAKISELVEGADKYISYVADEWMKENEVAIVESLEYEILKELHESVVSTYRDHNIVIPESKTDVVEELMSEIEELKTQLNEQTNKILEAQENEAQAVMQNTFDQVSEGLTKIDKERFLTLSESVEFEGDPKDFEKKLTFIRDHHFKAAKPVSKSYTTGILTEDFEDESESGDAEYVDPNVDRIAKAITKTVRKN